MGKKLSNMLVVLMMIVFILFSLFIIRSFIGYGICPYLKQKTQENYIKKFETSEYIKKQMENYKRTQTVIEPPQCEGYLCKIFCF